MTAPPTSLTSEAKPDSSGASLAITTSLRSSPRVAATGASLPRTRFAADFLAGPLAGVFREAIRQVYGISILGDVLVELITELSIKDLGERVISKKSDGRIRPGERARMREFARALRSAYVCNRYSQPGLTPLNAYKRIAPSLTPRWQVFWYALRLKCDMDGGW